MSYFAVEVCGPNNECWQFPPLGRKLRGRWSLYTPSMRNPGQPMRAIHAAVNSAGATAIPGQIVWVDVDKMTGGVTDALESTRDGQRVLAAIADVLKDNQALFETVAKPHPAVEHELSVDDVKTWLFLMRTAIDTKLAVQAAKSEDLPTCREIRSMPGRRIVDFNLPAGDNYTENDKTAAKRYADVVPVGKDDRRGASNTSTDQKGKQQSL